VKHSVLTAFGSVLLFAGALAQADTGSVLAPVDSPTSMVAAQDGMSLSQAVASIRRRGDVERVVSAKTENKNGREVHVIRYMTKDGKVKTARIQGRRR